MKKNFAGLVLRLLTLACLFVATVSAYNMVFWPVYPLVSVSMVAMLCFAAEEFKREVRP